MADPSFYLFDGYNLLHAGDLGDRRELVDRLASFVALQGARGVVVFDGVGEDERLGPLDVRFSPSADRLLERLAAEHRERYLVCLVSSDLAVRGTAGNEVRHRSSKAFIRELHSGASAPARRHPATRIGDAVDEETRHRLERFRRRGS